MTCGGSNSFDKIFCRIVCDTGQAHCQRARACRLCVTSTLCFKLLSHRQTREGRQRSFHRTSTSSKSSRKHPKSQPQPFVLDHQLAMQFHTVPVEMCTNLSHRQMPVRARLQTRAQHHLLARRLRSCCKRKRRGAQRLTRAND